MNITFFTLFLVLVAVRFSDADIENLTEDPVNEQTKNGESKTEDKTDAKVTDDTNARNGNISNDTKLTNDANKEDLTVNPSTDKAETLEIEGASKRSGDEESTNSEEKVSAQDNRRSANDEEQKEAVKLEKNGTDFVADVNDTTEAASIERSAVPDESNAVDETETDKQVDSDVNNSTKVDNNQNTTATEEHGAISRSGMPDYGYPFEKLIPPSELVLGSSLDSGRNHHGVPSLGTPLLGHQLPFEPLSGIASQRRYSGDAMSYQHQNLQIPAQFINAPGSYDANLRGTASLLNSMHPESYSSFKSIVPETRFRPNVGRREPLRQFKPDENSYPYSPSDSNTLNSDFSPEMSPSNQDYRKVYGSNPNILRYLYGDLARFRRSLSHVNDHYEPYYRYRFSNNRRRNYNFRNQNFNWVQM